MHDTPNKDDQAQRLVDTDDDDRRLKSFFAKARTATTNKARDAALRAALAYQRSKKETPQ